MLTSPSPDSTRFAALCMRERAGKAGFSLRYYSIKSEEPLFTIDLDCEAVYSLAHTQNGQLVLICDDVVYTYDIDGPFPATTAF